MKQGLDCSSCYIRLYVVYGCCWLLVVYSYSVYDGPSKNITQLRPRGLTLAALKASEDGGGGSCFWIKHTLACMLVVGDCSSSTSTEKPPQPSKYSPFLHFSILAGSSIYYIVVRHSLRGCSFFMEVIGIDPLSDAGKIRPLTSGFSYSELKIERIR